MSFFFFGFTCLRITNNFPFNLTGHYYLFSTNVNFANDIFSLRVCVTCAFYLCLQPCWVCCSFSMRRGVANIFRIFLQSAKEGEPFWESPWGPGRPGWHIECSAMSAAYLGHSFDIHGGGMDLVFPHHENEIAQSCAACKQSNISYWIHNGFVTVDSEKMSKSLGNFFTIRQVQFSVIYFNAFLFYF